MNEYIKAFKNYAVFTGRSTRADFWIFTFFNTLIWITLLFLPSTYEPIVEIGTWVFMLYCIVIIIPTISICVRRLHDIGKSGWWYWVSIIPYIGGVILLVFMLIKSDVGLNKYDLVNN